MTSDRYQQVMNAHQKNQNALSSAAKRLNKATKEVVAATLHRDSVRRAYEETKRLLMVLQNEN